jgi:hypothetical protein
LCGDMERVQNERPVEFGRLLFVEPPGYMDVVLVENAVAFGILVPPLRKPPRVDQFVQCLRGRLSSPSVHRCERLNGNFKTLLVRAHHDCNSIGVVAQLRIPSQFVWNLCEVAGERAVPSDRVSNVVLRCHRRSPPLAVFAF